MRTFGARVAIVLAVLVLRLLIEIHGLPIIGGGLKPALSTCEGNLCRDPARGKPRPRPCRPLSMTMPRQPIPTMRTGAIRTMNRITSARRLLLAALTLIAIASPAGGVCGPKVIEARPAKPLPPPVVWRCRSS